MRQKLVEAGLGGISTDTAETPLWAPFLFLWDLVLPSLVELFTISSVFRDIFLTSSKCSLPYGVLESKHLSVNKVLFSKKLRALLLE